MSVNVYTEWGKLKEIIVGSTFNLEKIDVDLSFKLFFHDNIKDVFLKNSYNLKKKVVEQREEDLDNFQKVLESLGVIVKRPKILEEIQSFQTPEFESHTCPVTNPRDQVLVIGNEVIETSCMNRYRYFENDLMKDIFQEYFDKGARWTCAPRPTLHDKSYDYDYVKRNGGKASDWKDFENHPELHEIMFDGAQCLKFGKDILMNVSTANHELGAIWLQRHLGENFNVHLTRMTDNHIDGMFMPLRPGVLLVNPITMHDKIHLLPEPLRKWDTLVLPKVDESKCSEDEILLASSNIPVNVLPIDEEKVIIFDSGNNEADALMKVLEKNKFTPIRIRLRHSKLFGGGAHCATLDTIREDKLEDFFN